MIALAKEKGYDADTKAGTIVEGLKQGFGSRPWPCAMALVDVIKHWPKISTKHVGSTGVHRDESDTLHLDGIANR